MLQVKKLRSILYVEDESEIQEELAEVLENFCDVLYRADDGFQGLDLFYKHTPEMIVTDIKMPVMDGIKMSKKIKSSDESVPIIFTTAFSDVGYFQEAIELQVEGYLLKPINLELLEKKIFAVSNSLQLKKDLEDNQKMLLQTSKLAAMGEMVGNIGHQWKQPLSVISMSATAMKVLKENENLEDDEFYTKCDLINEHAQYLAQTIDDFKNFFNPQQKNQVFNLKEYLNKCIDLVSATFDQNMIKTVREIDDKINSFGDPNQLLQAIINILNNAKDALETASNIREKLVFIFTVTEDKEDITITIKDNAGGIPAAILERIFEPYFTTKDNSKGTGLGLYITHAIITKNLKGTISVENDIFTHEGEEYKGAQFVIRLPLVNR